MKTIFRFALPVFVAAGLLGGFLWAIGFQSNLSNSETWQRQASPGRLSAAHQFLETNCAACHTPVKGAEASKCIACHAENPSLLQRQPTAFHAAITSCVECHREHQGIEQRPTNMDHQGLAKIGLRELRSSERPALDNQDYERLVSWISQYQASNEASSSGHAGVSPSEALLDCTTCHGNKDRHYQFFGRDCAQCHATAHWSIADFRHPTPNSTDCAQCHQAPPSHYMGHFHMVSARVARQEHANVTQCYLCHQTTAWNDIKGVGWYKHH